jgi:hypothetical protein
MQKILSTRLDEATLNEMERVTRAEPGTDLGSGALQRAGVVLFLRPRETDRGVS